MSPYPSPKLTGTPIIVPPDEVDAQEALRLFPEPSVRLAIAEVYGDISFPDSETSPRIGVARPTSRPYVLINMIASLDGKATVNGKAGSIGTLTDRVLMRTLRAHADAVMIGAGTIRAEKLTLAVPERMARARAARGLRPQPLAVVPTASGDAPLRTNLLGATPENLLVVASAETPAERLMDLSSLAVVEMVAAGETATFGGMRLDLSKVLQILKERYTVDVLLVEGGPRLNHSLVSLGLADEFFLTLAPKLLGGERSGSHTTLEGSLLPPDGIAPKLLSVHLYADELFLRYSLRPKEGTIRSPLR